MEAANSPRGFDAVLDETTSPDIFHRVLCMTSKGPTVDISGVVHRIGSVTSAVVGRSASSQAKLLRRFHAASKCDETQDSSCLWMHPPSQPAGLGVPSRHIPLWLW